MAAGRVILLASLALGALACGGPSALSPADARRAVTYDRDGRRLRDDQCLDEVSRRVIARSEPGAVCEATPTRDPRGARATSSDVGTRHLGVPAAAPESHLLANVAATGLALGVLGGTTYCAIECPEPWDVAVPATVGGLVVVGLIVAFVATADRWNAMAATR